MSDSTIVSSQVPAAWAKDTCSVDLTVWACCFISGPAVNAHGLAQLATHEPSEGAIAVLKRQISDLREAEGLQDLGSVPGSDGCPPSVGLSTTASSVVSDQAVDDSRRANLLDQIHTLAQSRSNSEASGRGRDDKTGQGAARESFIIAEPTQRTESKQMRQLHADLAQRQACPYLSARDVQRLLVCPATAAPMCRYVELPHIFEAVGGAGSRPLEHKLRPPAAWGRQNLTGRSCEQVNRARLLLALLPTSSHTLGIHHGRRWWRRCKPTPEARRRKAAVHRTVREVGPTCSAKHRTPISRGSDREGV